jgi:ribosome-associated protein
MQKESKSTQLNALKTCIIDGMQDNKAKDIVVLDLTGIENSITDYFIICTGESSTQIEGISSSIVRNSRKELKEKPWHTEGKGTSEWILLDYINIVVHIFGRETRDYYSIEDLWADAIRTDIPNLD